MYFIHCWRNVLLRQRGLVLILLFRCVFWTKKTEEGGKNGRARELLFTFCRPVCIVSYFTLHVRSFNSSIFHRKKVFFLQAPRDFCYEKLKNKLEQIEILKCQDTPVRKAVNLARLFCTEFSLQIKKIWHIFLSLGVMHCS